MASELMKGKGKGLMWVFSSVIESTESGRQKAQVDVNFLLRR